MKCESDRSGVQSVVRQGSNGAGIHAKRAPRGATLRSRAALWLFRIRFIFHNWHSPAFPGRPAFSYLREYFLIRARTLLPFWPLPFPFSFPSLHIAPTVMLVGPGIPASCPPITARQQGGVGGARAVLPRDGKPGELARGLPKSGGPCEGE